MVDRDKLDNERAIKRKLVRFLSNGSSTQLQTLGEELKTLFREPVEVWCLGGVLRDLIAHSPSRRPRDIDLVVGSTEVESLIASRHRVHRRTRFGGVHLRVGHWNVDLWPIAQTWAFKEKLVQDATFDNLPRTTFLNVEAIAAQVWATGRPSRRIADAGFFEALQSKTLDINLEPNPFPTLCIVRTLVLATQLRYALSARLVDYLVGGLERCSVDELLDIQLAHYGCVRLSAAMIDSWRCLLVSHAVRHDRARPDRVTAFDQRPLFASEELAGLRT